MIQLRCRTMYYFGETFAPLDRIMKRLKATGCTAAGIVDPGTWGHLDWADSCKKADIVPLYGVQIAVVPDLAYEDRPQMWFIALSSAGLKELYRYSSLSQRQSARGTARLLEADVQAMSSDIAKFAGAVTNEKFLLSVKAHIDFDPVSELLNKKKLKLLTNKKLKPVLVSDSWYAAQEDRSAFEMIGRQMRVTPQHLLSEPELTAMVPPEVAAAAKKNMEALVEKARSVELPKAPMIRAEGSLDKLCIDGIIVRQLRQRGIWTKVYDARLELELNLIKEKDFESYFLIVADMTLWAKERMLVGPSRGSAAGSLVCYLLRITEVDPIPNGLIFERFIDTTRNDLPDIDLDFPDTKRHLVIQYLRDKYGSKNVSHIGTVTTFKPKSALIAVAKKLGVPPFETSAVKDSIFERSSGDSRANFALMDTLEQTEPGRKLIERHPAMRLAADIEAHASNAGVHASGILVCNEAIENFCTVTADGIAQLDKKEAEKLNLLKIDILGLRTLGVIEDSGVEADWYNLDFHDTKVFKVLNDRRYAGIFQFEGDALQSVCSQMEVKTLEDIGHITALARPGPMSSGGTTMFLLRRAGKEAFRVPHPAMEPYVHDTFGVVIYQEQVLSICKELGDMSWEDVTLLRKAMSKTLGKEYFDTFRDKFVTGAKKNGIEKEHATEIWEMVNSMGSWAFNLAHSYSYAIMSYWTAWLKANHLLEFAAATLRNAKDESSSIKLLRELVNEGISYLPFDPDLSQKNWSVQNGQLVGGFMGLKGIGESKADKIITEREANGGKLTEKKRAALLETEQTYADIFPTARRFDGYYKEPQAFGIREGTRVSTISEIKGEAEFVYIGRMVGKDLRDHNEAIRVKRRDGKVKKGPSLFLDLVIEDDTGKVLTRIERYDFEEIGRTIWEGAPVNSWWLVRAKRELWGRPDGGFIMTYVKRIKQLPDPFARESKK